jgi:hypothetical protein
MARRNLVVLRQLDRGALPSRRRSRLDRFAYGVVCGVLLGGALFAFGVVRADEGDDAPRFSPAGRGGRVLERGEVLERAEVEALAAASFGPELAGYVANIARCESTFDPNADRNWPYVGLLQIDPYLHAAHVAAVVGYPVDAVEAAALLRIPRVNLATAARIAAVQGFGAWPWCSR